jgi:hypothetical protein
VGKLRGETPLNIIFQPLSSLCIPVRRQQKKKLEGENNLISAYVLGPCGVNAACMLRVQAKKNPAVTGFQACCGAGALLIRY